MRVIKNNSRSGASWTNSLLFCFWPILNSMNYSFDILALCETNWDDSIDSGNFYVRSYLPLIQKDSVTCMHGLAVYVKEGNPFALELSLENSMDSCIFNWLYFVFLYQSPSLSLYKILYSLSSNIDEVLLINWSANVFVFGDFNIHHKDWLTYSCGTDRLGELSCIFLT